MDIYLIFFKIIKRILSFFKKNNHQKPLIKSPHQSGNNNSVELHLPDVAVLEHTMFMLQRVRSAFNFSSDISLIPEMRIINKGLSYLYNTPKAQLSDDKKAISQEVTYVVQKFSYILPEIECLLSKIENLTTHQADNEQAEALKEQIVFALEKVSYEKNSLISENTEYSSLDENKNYHIALTVD